jgi:glycosyltransferase involved in cell wall biosynthesis
MARRLRALGHQVNVITTERQGQVRKLTWDIQTIDGIRIHRLGLPYSNRMGYPKRVLVFLEFLFFASFKAVNIKSDLVFATSTPLTIGIPAVYASRMRRVPMVFEVRDLWPEVPIAMSIIQNPLFIIMLKWLERYIYANSSHIIALSPGMGEGIKSHARHRTQITVIPNGCDLELFRDPPKCGVQFRRQHRWLQRRPLVVYTGAIGKVNGLSYMVRLAAETGKADPQIRFLIIGDGCEYDLVQDLAMSFGILNRSFFIWKGIPKFQIPAVLSASDIATSFTIDNMALWNNSANKFFDALAAGRPIAINHEGWLADLIRRYAIGLVLPSNDIGASADQLVTFLHDRKGLISAGLNARKLAETRFDREKMVQKLNEIFMQVNPKP